MADRQPGVLRCSGSFNGVTPAELDVLKGLYETAFPPHLRVSWSDMIAEVAEGATILWVLPDGAGFAHARPLGSSLPLFLEYMAVAPQRSGGWLGSQLMRTVTSDVAAGDGVVFEIEPPDDGDAHERRHRVARQHFYERLGAAVVDGTLGYRVPTADGASLCPLRLMWHPGWAGVNAPSGRGLARVLHALAVDGYGLEPGSEAYRAILGG